MRTAPRCTGRTSRRRSCRRSELAVSVSDQHRTHDGAARAARTTYTTTHLFAEHDLGRHPQGRAGYVVLVLPHLAALDGSRQTKVTLVDGCVAAGGDMLREKTQFVRTNSPLSHSNLCP
jgi:hypothetical protein